VSYFTTHEAIDPKLYQEDMMLKEVEMDPILFKATSDPDTLYMHEAMKAPNADQFKEAMRKEAKEHTRKGHWKVVCKEDVPSNSKILPSVWSMKRKRRIKTHEVYKHKARLNIGGHKQEYGVHYCDTYSPVVRWTSICIMLILSILQGWSTRQLDFVMAYPQADISTDRVYIEIPKGFEFEGSRDTHCLHVLKNIYGEKDAGQTWNLHLVKGLKELGFDQSRTIKCVFFQGTRIFMVYVDDGILIDPDGSKIDEAMNDLQSKFEVQEDEGDLSDYLGVKIQKHPDGSIECTELQLINSILEDLKLIGHGGEKSAKVLDTPSKHDGKLNQDEGGRVLDYSWDY
jgi:Reverse transcriptase (RNA-dependent DNA polymerase)